MLHNDPDAQIQPGALGKGQPIAVLWSNVFMFWAYGAPLLGAFISDQYWGKFKTILVFSTIYMIGWIFLTGTSIPSSYDEDGTPHFGSISYAGYIISIFIIGMGTGGIKSVVSPMVADQVSGKPYIKETPNGRVVIDPDLTIQRLYNWFYWAINLGALIGQTAW